MRWRTALILLPLIAAASCTAPSVPAPWESVENPASEPKTSLATLPAEPLWQRLGSSIRGKPIQAATFGTGPSRLYIIGGIHGDQPEGPAAIQLLAESLASAPIEAATVRIIRHMNPDAEATGTRVKTRGIDLNRNWPTPDFASGPTHGPRAASELETSTIHADLVAFKPDLVIILGTSARGPAIAFEGAGHLPHIRAYEFAAAARREDPRWRLVTEPWTSSTGSIESFTRDVLKRAVLNAELPRAADRQQQARAIQAGLAAFAANAPAAK